MFIHTSVILIFMKICMALNSYKIIFNYTFRTGKKYGIMYN